jgi:asparagine synthase (glutamine-hydrolysing)
MCGITGIAHAGPGRRPLHAGDVARVEAMCAAMFLRGPDGGGVDAHPEVILGMRRLAIVDIEHGKQPMRSDDGSITLVYNGEIYNAPALRARLQAKGVTFRTRSDTEVLLRLYEDDPTSVESELAGMWAFAIHDRRRRSLLLSRDRFGIKPLFVADMGGSIAFASDLRCFAPLRSDSAFAPAFRVDMAAAHAMVAWSYVPELATIFSGVVRLGPGTRLEIDLGTGARKRAVHWRPTASREATTVASMSAACDLVESALRRSAREHLESDVPVAAFVSGGIDSSLVAAYAQEASSSPIRAYSIGFRERAFDESRHAKTIATALGMQHTVEVLDEAAMRSALADALLAYDEPFGDSSSLATFVLCRRVAREHKVALAGDGGDESFAGYRKHRIVGVRAVLGRIPGALRLLGTALGALPTHGDRTKRRTELLRSARRLAAGLRTDDAEAYVALTQVADLGSTRPLLATPDGAERLLEQGEQRFLSYSGSQLRRTLSADLGSVLPNDMLTKVDRASMACSLEARVPMLDHRLVELGLGLPPSFTLGGMRGPAGKVVLKELFRRRFGDALANRTKQGFSVPIEKWFATWLAAPCDALFDRRRLEQHGVLSPSALANGRWREWARTAPQVLWHAFALAAWTEQTLGAGPDSLREILASR